MFLTHSLRIVINVLGACIDLLYIYFKLYIDNLSQIVSSVQDIQKRCGGDAPQIDSFSVQTSTANDGPHQVEHTNQIHSQHRNKM